MLNFNVSRADVTFEAKFAKPDFELMADDAAFLERLFQSLQPHGLRTADMRFEPGDGSLGDEQLVCQIPALWLTIRVRIDRVEIISAVLLRDQTQTLKGILSNVLAAIAEQRPGLPFSSYAMTLNLHGSVDGTTMTAFLARLLGSANSPGPLGPPIGNGVVFYYGAQDDRIVSSVTADLSALVPEAIFVRVHAQWDSQKVAPASVVEIADKFAQGAIATLDLQIPAVNRAQ